MRKAIVVTLSLLGACARKGAGSSAPSFAMAPGEPAPRARYSADCIAQSSAALTYDRDGARTRFHCNRAPAQAFYQALASFNLAAASQYHANGLTWRFTKRLEHNRDGLDFCTRADAAGAYVCTLIFNAGAFINP
jgi:hypothetical protein